LSSGKAVRRKKVGQIKKPKGGFDGGIKRGVRKPRGTGAMAAPLIMLLPELPKERGLRERGTLHREIRKVTGKGTTKRGARAANLFY